MNRKKIISLSPQKSQLTYSFWAEEKVVQALGMHVRPVRIEEGLRHSLIDIILGTKLNKLLISLGTG